MSRHALDLTSLLAGLVFVAVAIGFLAGGIDSQEAQLTVMWPLLLIALGIALLAGGPRQLEDGKDRDDEDAHAGHDGG